MDADKMDAFLEAVSDFRKAAFALSAAWVDGDFNADTEYPALFTDEGGKPLFTMSLDEWVLELPTPPCRDCGEQCDKNRHGDWICDNPKCFLYQS